MWVKFGSVITVFNFLLFHYIKYEILVEFSHHESILNTARSVLNVWVSLWPLGVIKSFIPNLGYLFHGLKSMKELTLYINEKSYVIKSYPCTLVEGTSFVQGLRIVARIFSPTLARKSNGFARILLTFFCPKMAIWKILYTYRRLQRCSPLAPTARTPIMSMQHCTLLRYIKLNNHNRFDYNLSIYSKKLLRSKVW